MIENKTANNKSIDEMLAIYRNMVDEVSRLEKIFPGRHFTLDGHLIGSIGEVFAQERYGIDLADASNPIYDGTIDKHYVQIKTVQQDRVSIRYDISQELDVEPLLLVLYLNKSGHFYEVFNGPIDVLLKANCQVDKKGYIHVGVNKLIKLQLEHNQYKIVPNKKVDYLSLIHKKDLKSLCL